MSYLQVDNISTQTINTYKTNIVASSFDSSGRVRSPNNPVFYGYRNTSGAWESYSGSTYIYNIAVTNIGNCYNTANGIFTCPIDGIYGVAPGALMGNNGNYSTLQVYKNDINVTARGVHSNTVGTNNWFHQCTIFLIRCSKDDTLKVWCTTGAATIYGSDGYSHCSIWLL